MGDTYSRIVKATPDPEDNSMIACATFFPRVFVPRTVALLLSRRAAVTISLADAVWESVKINRGVSVSALLFVLKWLSDCPLVINYTLKR